MSANLENFSYMKTWSDFSMDSYEGNSPRMSDYHMHDYYEISIIFSENIKVLLPDRVDQSCGQKAVLLRPGTAHYINFEKGTYYSRQNILFSDSFIDSSDLDCRRLLSVFCENGNIIPFSGTQSTQLKGIIDLLYCESDTFRKKLLLLYLISIIADFDGGSKQLSALPACVSEALKYINANYMNKITASELAWKLGVGRTTLMTSFKKYTGTTLCEYTVRQRLKNAVKMINEGKLLADVSELCGFCDTGGLIRAFKKQFGTTPIKYISGKKKGRQ